MYLEQREHKKSLAICFSNDTCRITPFRKARSFFLSYLLAIALVQAYASARMAESTLLGLNGEPNIYECAYVDSQVRRFELWWMFEGPISPLP